MNKIETGNKTAFETLRANFAEVVDALMGVLEIAEQYKIGFTTTLEQEQQIIKAREVVAKHSAAASPPKDLNRRWNDG